MFFEELRKSIYVPTLKILALVLTLLVYHIIMHHHSLQTSHHRIIASSLLYVMITPAFIFFLQHPAVFILSGQSKLLHYKRGNQNTSFY